MEEGMVGADSLSAVMETGCGNELNETKKMYPS